MIGFVTLVNIQCSVWFITKPVFFAPAYQLAGIPGNIAIQGFGILFLMWNIPYLFATINPIKYKVSLIEAVLMQTTGLFGEAMIYLNLPNGYPLLSDSMMRFIRFDAAGLLILAMASFLVIEKKNNIS
jgi:hypothetical protein